MDQTTLDVYARMAPEIAARHRATEPAGVQQLILTYFCAGAATADIGCGCGRDVAWLSRHGYPATGFDAAEAMLDEARRAYPDERFEAAVLPEIAGIPDGAFANVLCAAVLMHLPREDLITAVLSLARILREGGRLVLSYRGSESAREREADGRLFTEIPPGRLTLLLEAAGFEVLHRRFATRRSAVAAGGGGEAGGERRSRARSHPVHPGAGPEDGDLQSSR